jgi:hypothetical protein
MKASMKAATLKAPSGEPTLTLTVVHVGESLEELRAKENKANERCRGVGECPDTRVTKSGIAQYRRP